MKNGFTLIEVVVAIAVFMLVVISSTGLFVSGLRAQRESLGTQEILDQTSYLMEYMSRALRMAKKDDIGAVNCLSGYKINYEFTGQCIKFVSSKDECQQFCLNGARMEDENGNFLTGEALAVSAFNVIISGQFQPSTDYLQPKVTIFLNIQGESDGFGEQPEIKIQSTVSQRNPDIRR